MVEWFSTSWFLPSTLRSFEWENPIYLYLILGSPILFILRWLLNSSTRQKLNLTLSEQSFSNNWQQYLRFLVPIFFSLGFIFLCISLARPQRALNSEESLHEGINVILAIDISESMQARDLKPSRLEAAKEVALQFIRGRKYDKIGLVVFAGESYTLCPLTSDYKLLENFLVKISPGMISTSGTAIGNAIATSINRLRDSPGESKAIILLSDGDNTAGNLAPATATDLARSFGIRIYSIAIGRNQREELIDKKTLTAVADDSEGSFFSAGSNESLSTVFTQIDEQEKTRFHDSILKELKDFYYIYLNWAIIFFLMAFFLKNTFMGNVLED